MSSADVSTEARTAIPAAQTIDLKLEIIVVPVTDVDRSKAFYQAMGWRLDADFVRGDDFRVVQLTPPGSRCSVIIGTGITDAVPGSMQGMVLVANDLEAARAELAGHGVNVSEPFHDAGRVFHRAGSEGRVQGLDPDRHSYASFAAFSDPDGNGWLVQEITTRLPGR
jgi:catechol 2,3-dioxygenase-like lactoylglutathione lyase family enzyme